MQGNQLIQDGSRALTETEKRYSQIEKKMLSIVCGLTPQLHLWSNSDNLQYPQTSGCCIEETLLQLVL